MKVTRLEIFGFKSFMDRTVLSFNEGICGVVGPNGCGKSNIVDALRWVLGETRARSIRGTTLEDVIFNGTDKLRPLGLAEVTITLRSKNENFLQELVSPSLESDLVESLGLNKPLESNKNAEPSQHDQDEDHIDVESENQIQALDSQVEDANKSALNINPELLAELESQIDTENDLNLGLEAAEQVLNNQDDLISDDPETEKQDANNNSASISLLQRFSWLKAANELQVTRRYYRSGESEYFINKVACRLKDVAELFQALSMGPRAYTIVAQNEVSKVVTAKPEERRMILEEAAGVLGFRDRIAAAKRRLEETVINISRLDDILKEVTRQVNSLKRQAQRAENRQSLKDQVSNLEKMLLADEYVVTAKRQTEVEKLLAQAKELEIATTAKFETAHAEEQQARQEMMQVDVESDAVRSKLDSVRESLARQAAAKTKIVNRINEISTIKNSREGEISRQKERLEQVAQRINLCEESLKELTSLGEQLSFEFANLQGVDDQILVELKNKIRQLRDTLRGKEQSLSSLRDQVVSKTSQLDSHQKQMLSMSPAAQLKRTIGEQANGLDIAQAKLLIQAIKVDPQYEKALGAALAEKASFIVSPELNAIAEKFVSKLNSASNGLGIIRPSQETAMIADSTQNLSQFKKLADCLQVDSSLQSALNSLLNNVYIAENLEQAKEALTVLPQATFVTLQGSLINAHCFQHFNIDGGLVIVQGKINQLSGTLEGLKAEYESGLVQKNALSEQITILDSEYEAALKQNREQAAKAREISSKQGNVSGRVDSAKRLLQELNTDNAQAQRQIESSHNLINQLLAEKTELEQKLAELEKSDNSNLEAELQSLSQENSRLEMIRREGRQKLSMFSERVNYARREMEQSRQQATNRNFETQRIIIELENLTKKITEIFGEVDFNQFIQTQEPLSLDQKSESQAELRKIKDRIQREGDVDPTSIERCAEESKRLEDLTQQRADLDSAHTTLKTTIERLTEASKQRFMSTFKTVTENFEKLIPRLFGGGFAKLELSDPNNPLESGVEVIVRPPGKKVKSIELLSGGEKSLCAAALIVSMFVQRPSPLCVLDEVEAALDESNLIRFLTLVKEMSTKTQFLVITHNKQTMSICDNLVGVTMEQPGITKTISVSLQEAYQQVA